MAFYGFFAWLFQPLLTKWNDFLAGKYLKDYRKSHPEFDAPTHYATGTDAATDQLDDQQKAIETLDDT